MEPLWYALLVLLFKHIMTFAAGAARMTPPSNNSVFSDVLCDAAGLGASSSALA